MAFDYRIVLNDSSGLGGADDALLVTDLSAALGDWSTHVNGQGVLTVQLNVTSGAVSGELASGGPTSAVISGFATGIIKTETSSEVELLTGKSVSGLSSDITINVPASALSSLYLNSDPTDSSYVPANLYDAVSVFRHEIMHGLGMAGYLNNVSLPGLSKYQTAFDADVEVMPNGAAYFVGANAEAAYGGPVPLTTDNLPENLYHLAEAKTDPLGNDLMNGLGMLPGQSYQISAVDLGILKDIGVPIGNKSVSALAVVAAKPFLASGAAGTTTTFNFTVTRHGDLTNAQTLNYAVTGINGGNGVIAAGVDDFPGDVYPSGTVSFAAGSNTATINVQVAGTSVLKPAEAFSVVLYNAAGNALVGGDATILNNNVSSSPLGVSRDGTGTATIALQGTHGQYIVSPALYNSVTVQDTVASRDGTQTVQDAQAIVFGDGVGRFDATGNAEDVAHLYQAAFDRAPDLGGLDYWTNLLDSGVATLNAVSASFLAAPEFSGATNGQGLVEALYSNVLHRASDSSGLQYWSDLLSDGGSPAAVLIDFAKSPENLAATVSTIGDTHAAQATRLYQAAFDRAPDTAGLAFWTQSLQSGTAVQDIAAGFTASAEFAQSYGGLGNADLVAKLYQNVLGRAGDSSGAAFWTGQLNAGASVSSVLVGFSNSAENRADTAAATHDGWIFLSS